jgi:hypothetical protein
VAALSLRGAVIAYQRAITQSGRSSDKQLSIEEAQLPRPEYDPQTRNAMLNRFQENINQVAKSLPRVAGVDRPLDVQANFAKQFAAEDAQKIAAQKQQFAAQPAQQPGATHYYDPASRTVKPFVRTVPNFGGTQ